jgi:TonB family protein
MTSSLRSRLALLALCAAPGCAEEVPLPEFPPRLISQAEFPYPEDLWDEGVEGETTLRIFVAATGTVDTARVEVPSPYAAFDSAALHGGRRLRFEPARRGDQPIGAWFRLPVRFDITPAAGAASTSEGTP